MSVAEEVLRQLLQLIVVGLQSIEQAELLELVGALRVIVVHHFCNIIINMG